LKRKKRSNKSVDEVILGSPPPPPLPSPPPEKKQKVNKAKTGNQKKYANYSDPAVAAAWQEAVEFYVSRVTYDSERRTAFIVHREEFALPNKVFDMHPCGLHVYYPKKIDGQYGLFKLLLTI
jgi:hypothetical protein